MTRSEQLRQEYMSLAHAVQSGVAATMQVDPKSTEPKHLRTGINLAMVEAGALATLLVGKGLVTEEEYLSAICTAVRAEKERYERDLSKHYGTTITLG